ncbi:MAG: helix-turn-helix domain-containing protein [Rhodospirillales bacterium]|nr:helix-turn-helix domain-containing protein [Rhodospirillales bacterium]
MTTSTSDALTSDQVASMLGIKRNTLEIWRCKGKGPCFIKLGTAKQAGVIYSRSDVEAWVAGHKFTSTSAYSAKGN